MLFYKQTHQETFTRLKQVRSNKSNFEKIIFQHLSDDSSKKESADHNKKTSPCIDGIASLALGI